MKCWSSSPGAFLTAPGTLQLRDKVSGGVRGRWLGRRKFSDLYSLCFLLCSPFGKKLLSPRWLFQRWHGLFELKFCRSIPSFGRLYPPETGISCQGGFELDLTGEARWQGMTVGRDLCSVMSKCFYYFILRRQVKVCEDLRLPESRRKCHNMTEGVHLRSRLCYCWILKPYCRWQRGRVFRERLKYLCRRNFRQKTNMWVATHSVFTDKWCEWWGHVRVSQSIL